MALLIKGIGKTIENISRKQKGKLLSMLLGTLAHGLFGKLLVGKVKILRQRVMRASEGTVRVGRIFNAASCPD